MGDVEDETKPKVLMGKDQTTLVNMSTVGIEESGF